MHPKTALATVLVAAAPIHAAFNDVIHPGTTAWFQAAQTGRADMLVLGDSVVLTQGNGWDAGFINALHNTVGLAGTGLMTGGAGDGEGYYFATNWSNDRALVPAEKRGYVWRGDAHSSGSVPTNGFFWGIDGSTLTTTAGYDAVLYTASATGTGSSGAYSRHDAPPYGTVQVLPAVPTAAPVGPGLNRAVFHFDGPTAPADQRRETFLQNATDTTVFYARVVAPGKTGATLTSWGYGGQSLLSFLRDQWLDPGTSADGRKAWLDALVDGGSGKLNVVINEGFNDRNDPRPSYNDVAASNTPAGHADNLRALIAAVRADWTASGRPLADLSFTLFSDYKDIYESTGPANGPLAQFAAAEALVAAADPQVSYVDVYGRSPDYAQLDALGYMFDGVHASKAGTDFFAREVVAALAPEPGAMWLLAAPVATLTARRRRSR